MLHLPTVSLMAIDTFRPQLTVRMMRHSMQLVKFAKAVLLTDTTKHGALLARHDLSGITLVHHEQSDKKVLAFPGGPMVPVDYEMAMIKEPANYCDSGFVHCLEWDSCVLNPSAWTNDFLKWDFIGAKWAPHTDPGWPPCTESNSVGNGGASLRSAKFCKLVREAADVFKGDPAMIVHDSWMCRTIRPWLEERGVKFAPEEVADCFSTENRIYCGSWAFHGKGTATLNGWGSFLAHIRT